MHGGIPCSVGFTQFFFLHRHFSSHELMAKTDLVTCAIIIISVELSPSLSRHLEREKVDRAWEICLAILQKLQNRDPRAQKYVISLNAMRDQARTGQNSTRPLLTPDGRFVAVCGC